MAAFTFAELTPTSLLDRSRVVHADRLAIVDGALRLTYAAHPDAVEVAVVGWPDDTWGEAVTTFVVLDPESDLSEVGIRDGARDRLAGFTVPRRVPFGPLPKTSTGKIRKADLRTPGSGVGQSG